MIKMSDFRQKEVINIQNGKRLGYISDAVIDEEDGRVLAFIVPAENRGLGIFGKKSEFVIEWENIQKTGNDIILVNIKEENFKKQ